MIIENIWSKEDALVKFYKSMTLYYYYSLWYPGFAVLSQKAIFHIFFEVQKYNKHEVTKWSSLTAVALNHVRYYRASERDGAIVDEKTWCLHARIKFHTISNALKHSSAAVFFVRPSFSPVSYVSWLSDSLLQWSIDRARPLFLNVPGFRARPREQLWQLLVRLGRVTGAHTAICEHLAPTRLHQNGLAFPMKSRHAFQIELNRVSRCSTGGEFRMKIHRIYFHLLLLTSPRWSIRCVARSKAFSDVKSRVFSDVGSRSRRRIVSRVRQRGIFVPPKTHLPIVSLLFSLQMTREDSL